MIAPFSLPFRHRTLLSQLARRDVAGRYRGSLLGSAWTLLLPLVMLGIYTFVFSFVFKARWNLPAAGGEEGGLASYGLVLFSGLMLHGFLSEVLSRAATIVVQHVNFVKKVVFPLELFPYMLATTAGAHLLISIAVLLIVHLLLGGVLTLSMLWAPAILLPLLLLALGCGWWLASLGVYLRDIGQLIQLAMTVLLFLSPIFYPLELLPEAVRSWLYLNPLTLIVSEFRNVMLWGGTPDFSALGVYFLVSLLVFFSGYWWFVKTKKGFADVL